MGGFMAACATARDPEVAGLVMISAWNIGATMSGPKETHRVDMIPSASSRLDCRISRPQSLLQQGDEGRLQKAGNTRVTETYLETDHSYSDHRIALQVAVLQWLDTVLAPVSK